MYKLFFNRIVSTTFLIFFLFFVMEAHAHASFNKSLWSIWATNNPLSTSVISHNEWQEFLDKHVITDEENINLVDYVNLTEADHELLKQYIARLSHIDIDAYNRDEQLAFWLNLYNALTVQIVAEYYPVSSIEEINISPGLFSIGPWGAKLVTINGTPLSLDDINNRIIRPVWNDPRTHYALNNGSIGAANLSKKAYHGNTLEENLNEAASVYINSLRGAQVIEGKLIVSKIYEWYKDDFGGSNMDIITHIQQFAKEPLFSQLNHINTIDGYIYNWHLNATIVKKL